MNTKFSVSKKVAFVTGGASGIGLAVVKELLKNDAKGVAIVDFNFELGQQALSEICKEFGRHRAIFIPTDVSDSKQLKNAFEETVKTFKNLDIVVNNAGIINENDWKTCIATNLQSVIDGSYLAINTYLPKYKSEENSALVINTASVLAIRPAKSFAVYAATKAAIVQFSKSIGFTSTTDDINKQSQLIRVIAICPGLTRTRIADVFPDESKESADVHGVDPNIKVQSAEICAKGYIKLMENGASGTVWVVAEDKDPFEYKLPEELSLNHL